MKDKLFNLLLAPVVFVVLVVFIGKMIYELFTKQGNEYRTR